MRHPLPTLATLPRRLPAVLPGVRLGALLLAGLLAQGVAHAEGREIDLESPPAGAETWASACSLRHAMCVHGAPGTGASALLAALDALDRGWDVHTQALELPPPEADAKPTWDAYLVDGVPEGGRAALSSRDPRGALDRGESFGLIDRMAPPGCPLDVAAARSLAWGSLLRAAPATDAGTARAQTRMLARLATACAGSEEPERAFQAEPERTLVDPDGEARSSGASLFFDWVDGTFAGQPGALVVGTWALAPTTTAPAAWRWTARPTGFDVLGSSLAGALGTDSNLDDVFLQFGIDRGLALPPARVAWHVAWPAHARRLASPVAVAPSGTSYVLVDHAGAPAGANLRVEAMWEDYGRMKWAVVKLDAAGRPLAVLRVTSQPRATSTALTVELIDAVDRFLIVGVNVGSTEHTFDPGQGWWEPHGWVLTLSAG